MFKVLPKILNNNHKQFSQAFGNYFLTPPFPLHRLGYIDWCEMVIGYDARGPNENLVQGTRLLRRALAISFMGSFMTTVSHDLSLKSNSKDSVS